MNIHFVVVSAVLLVGSLKTITAGTPHHEPVNFNMNIHFVQILFLHLYHCGT